MHFQPMNIYNISLNTHYYSHSILVFNFHRSSFIENIYKPRQFHIENTRMHNPYISIEYCTNCSTHNWCTHHNEEKYQQAFLDLQFLIKKTFQNAKVVGNQVPRNLVPVKANENKYFDKKTNKYVIFPAIGAFEIVCDGQLVFSKKGKNIWPNLHEVVAKISQSSGQVPPEKEKNKKTQNSQLQPEIDTSSQLTVAHTQPRIREQDKNSTFYPSKNNLSHEFSLTDHFKRYKLKKNTENQSVITGSQGSEGRISKITAQDIKQLNKKTWGNEQNIPSFIKNKAYIQENNGGRKQMLINLSSIEQENEQKKGNYQLKKSKNSINRISKLGDEINKFEKRFSKFERKVEDINQKRMEFENQDQSKSIIGDNSRAVLKNDSPRKSDLTKFNTVDKIYEYNRKYNAMDILKEIKDNKNKKIEDYIHATSEEKNEKLSEIYGPYIFKKKYESANKHRHHKYRKSNNNSYSEKNNLLNRSKEKNKKLAEIIKNKENKGLPKYKKVSKKIDSSFSSMSSSEEESLDSRIHGSEDSNVEIEVSPELVEKHKRLNKIKANKIRLKAKKEKNLSNKVIPKKMLRDSQVKEQKHHTANNFYTKKKQTLIVQNQKGEYSPPKDYFSIQKIRNRGIKKTGEQKPTPKIFNPKPLSIIKPNVRNKQSVSQIHKKTGPQHHFTKISKINAREKLKPDQGEKIETIYTEKSNNYKQWRSDFSNMSHQLKKMKKRNLKYKRDSSLFDDEQKSMSNEGISKEETSIDHRNTLSFQPRIQKSFEDGAHYNQQKMNKEVKKEKKKKLINRIQQKSREVSSSSCEKQSQKDSISSSTQNQQKFEPDTKKKESKPIKKEKKTKEIIKPKVKKQKKDMIIQSSSSDQQPRKKLNFSQRKKEQKTKIKQKKIKPKSKPTKKQEHATGQSNLEESRLTVAKMGKEKNEKEQKSQISENEIVKEIKSIEMNEREEVINDQLRKKKAFSKQSKQNGNDISPKQKKIKNKPQEEITPSKKTSLTYSPQQKKISEQQEQKQGISKSSLLKPQSKNQQPPKEASSPKKNSTKSPKLAKKKKGSSIRKESKELKSPKSIKSKNLEEKSQSEESIKIEKFPKKKQLKKKTKNLQQKKKSKVIEEEYEAFNEGDISNNASKISEQNTEARLSHFSPLVKKEKEKLKSSQKSQRSKKKPKNRKQKISSVSSKKNSPEKKSSIKKNNKKNSKKPKKMKQKKMMTSSSSISQEQEESKTMLDEESLRIESQISERSKVTQNKLSKLFGENQTIKETSENNESPIMSVSNMKSKRDQSEYEREISRNEKRQNRAEQEQNSLNSKQTERKKSIKLLHQANNVVCEAKPKKIYAADQVPPQMSEKSTQTDNRVTKYVQTSEISDFSEEEQNHHKNTKNKSKKINEEGSEEINEPRKSSNLNILQEIGDKENAKKQQIFSSKLKSKSKSKSKVIISENERLIHEKPSEAKITQQFYGVLYDEQRKNTKIKLEDLNHFIEPVIDERSSSLPISTIFKKRAKTPFVLFGTNSIEPEKIIDHSGQMNELLRVIRILTSKNQYLILRLFSNANILSYQTKFGVWLCDNFKWRSFIVDHMVSIDQNKNPLFLDHQGNQYWPIILFKALSELFGGSENLKAATSGQIFHALTGCNNLSFRIKEDISKNSQMLKFITKNQRKNFILIASKRGYASIGEDIQQEKNTPIYYILSQKSINENQILIRMKKDNSDAFWIKLEKFVIDFKIMEVLQLRVNHNFSTFDITNHNAGKFHIYQLDFDDAGFGCVSVSVNKGSSEFKVYLYKEEEDNVMKLVGQAKQKNKRNLFFDCSFEEARYFLFIEMSSSDGRISFMGEVKPEITAKQSIKGQSFKNDKTEYIPVSSVTKKRDSGMPRFMAATMSGGFQASEKDNQSIIEFDKLSRVSKQSNHSNFKRDFIKKQFIEFLMENSS